MKKRGISLILLVITIIIIIIIATAVILNLNSNNPVDKARMANVQQTRDSLKSGINLYIAKIMVEENGNHKAQTMILGKNDEVKKYQIIAGDFQSGTTNSAIIQGSKQVWQLDYTKVNSLVNIKLDIYDGSSRWYIDEYGNPYLVYDKLSNVASYLKDETGNVSISVSDFVVYLDQDIEFVENSSSNNSSNNENENNNNQQAPAVTLNVGDIVNYPSNPTADASFTIPSYPQSDGTSTDGIKVTLAESENLTWKVWKKENGNYLITPTTPVATTVYIRGAAGYNNAVQALNAYCRKYYSDASNGVYARSINIEDIESSMTVAGIATRESYENYNQTVNPSTKTNYPGIYPLESNGTIGLSDAPSSNEYAVWSGDDYKSDGATAYVDGYKRTYYFSNSDILVNDYYDPNTENLLFSSAGYGSGFWVASRCVDVNSSSAYFNIRTVYSNGGLGGTSIFYSSSNSGGNTFALRPVVSIPESKIGDYVSN